MKKKVTALLMAVAMVASLAACGSKDNNDTPATDETPDQTDETPDAAPDDTPDQADDSADGYEIALVTDLGTIDDKSFNQGAWEGVVAYGEEFDVAHKYYQPTEKTTDAYMETIELAIKGGAKIVVCPGYLFEEAVFEVQDQYPEVKFIILDGEPHNADYSEFNTADNTMAILYQEDEAGFLAGYAAVKDGYEKLGFMGGMAVPAVIRFGLGYVQGAELAAEEMGLDSLEIFYHYTGGFEATPEAQTLAASWYEAGVEVIFGCGGAVGNSVMSAAGAADGAVIGVDVDQSSESDKVITSAMKQLSVSVYDGIKAYYDGSFPGGKTTIFSAANDGVGLPMENSKFESFTQADYDALFEKLANGDIEIKNDTEVAPTDLGTSIVTVNVVD